MAFIGGFNWPAPSAEGAFCQSTWMQASTISSSEERRTGWIGFNRGVGGGIVLGPEDNYMISERVCQEKVYVGEDATHIYWEPENHLCIGDDESYNDGAFIRVQESRQLKNSRPGAVWSAWG